jgi:hypothetical protein
MTKEEIEKKGFEAYPRTTPLDDFALQREGYIKALTDIESLQKIRGRIARDEDGDLMFYTNDIERDEEGFWTSKRGDDYIAIDKTLFPELTWKSQPVEVELLVRLI